MTKARTTQLDGRTYENGWLRSKRRVGLVVLLVCVLVLALLWLHWMRAPESDEEESAASIAARADASVALQALKGRDLMVLGDELAKHRADPAFAYFFTAEASPRELGDVLATVAEPDHLGLKGGVDSSAYEIVLTDLAETLSLATQNNDGFDLPATWAEDFAAYTTQPVELGEESPEADRAAQDQANRQNLLLLLSRGRWGTEFLTTVTTAFWEWEHDPSVGGDPWPGVPLVLMPYSGADARFAPAPNGAFLTDGMVALMAAMTSNSEAAGWAFVDFQPGTRSVSVDGADHQMGAFAHYLFFGRTDSGIADAADAGSSTLVTALKSAVRATGGSYVDGTVSPRADAYILEDYQAALEEEAERQQGVWYKQVGRSAMAVAHFLHDHGHSILDVVATVPVVGAPADVANGVWSGIEGDWSAAGLSAAGVVPVLGDTLAVVVKANKAVKLIKRGVGATERIAAADDLPKGATDLGSGVLQFEKTDDFLAALDAPSPGFTYQLGETTYRVGPDGKSVTHVGGPSRNALRSADKVKVLRSRVVKSAISVLKSARDLAQEAEEQGLLEYELKFKISVDPEQVLAHVDGLVSGRFYDGLALKDDGTYEAVDVLYGDEDQSGTQIRFDDAIGIESPALATLKIGETVKITSVVVVRVTP